MTKTNSYRIMMPADIKDFLVYYYSFFALFLFCILIYTFIFFSLLMLLMMLQWDPAWSITQLGLINKNLIMIREA